MSVEDSCWSVTTCPLLGLFVEEEEADVEELVLGGGGGGAPLTLADGYGILRHNSTAYFKEGNFHQPCLAVSWKYMPNLFLRLMRKIFQQWHKVLGYSHMTS